MLLAFAGPTIQLVPDGTLLFHLFLIITMVAVLNATLLKPINRILEERDKRTKGRLSEAQTAMRKVEEEVREYERRLREARTAGYALIEHERAALASERERKLAQVKTEIGGQLADGRELIRAESEQAKAVLSNAASSIAVEISSQILHRPVSGRTT